MKLVSWNVNGLRACVNKGFLDYFNETKADIFCIQETKLQSGQIQLELGDEYMPYWNYAQTKGYSGTAIFTRIKPLSVRYNIDLDEKEDEPDSEGRIVALEFDSFYLVNVYTPNARRDLSRLPLRLEWEDRFRGFIQALDKHKPVIICGDLNVAHHEIDLKNAKGNRNNSGFTLEEREKMTVLLDSGFIDTFRYLYPERTDVYSWWSNMPGVRDRNVGWRIDYFLMSSRLSPLLVEAQINCEIRGSDHCPVVLDISI
jgi:exodeoxyribonuclease-3